MPTNSFRGGQRRSASDGMQTASVKDNLRKTFTIHYRSEMDGKTYEGQFTVKKLSIRDLGQIGTIRSQLNGGMHYDENNPGVGIDEQTHMTNNMIAHLEVALLQQPTWFDLDEIYDLGLVGEVFKHIAEFENSFFRSRRSGGADQSDGVSQESGNGTNEGSGVAGSVKAVGGGAVQPTLDP